MTNLWVELRYQTAKRMTPHRDLFVMGGAEPSVGVVGWGIGGGFGAQSKRFGTGAANMLQARVVTADGRVVVASEFQASE